MQALHQRFYEPVTRYIQFKVGDPHLVEDLCSEVFVRVLQGLKRGQAWQDSPQGWIFGIARHVVADHYRQKERISEVELSEGLPAASEIGPAHQTMLNGRTRPSHQAIHKLNDERFRLYKKKARPLRTFPFGLTIIQQACRKLTGNGW